MIDIKGIIINMKKSNKIVDLNFPNELTMTNVVLFEFRNDK